MLRNTDFKTNVVIIHIDDIEGMTPDLRTHIPGGLETFTLYITGDKYVVEYGKIFQEEQPLLNQDDIFNEVIITKYKKIIGGCILQTARTIKENG